MTFPLSRRTLLGSALAAGVALPLGPPKPNEAKTLTLPRPTGPYPIGTVPLHLVDPARSRELMAAIWYPAAATARHRKAQWMDPAPLRPLLVSADFDPDSALSPVTEGHLDAPVRRTGEKMPVVLYSHAAHDHRSETTVIVQELASHGYVVATVDHTYDAYSQFPDGRVIVPVDDPVMLPPDFARDLTFVLDQLEAIARGHNPDVDGRPLPAGLGAALDLRRVGAFGHSKGGTATALAMDADSRVKAGLILDGPMVSDPAPAADLDRPVMLMTAVFTRADSPPVAEFWSHLRGWRRNIQADGALHPSYTDYQTLITQMAAISGLSDDDLYAWIGTLDPDRAVKIQQAYPPAFFDLHLRHRDNGLLNGPSPAFPEVRFLP